MTPEVEHTTVFRADGRFAGWPANYGMWSWGEEIVVVFALGWIGPSIGLHARDTSRPFLPTQARSTDGGRSWRTEPFGGRTPGSPVLSADEHVADTLKAGARLRDDAFVPVPRGLDFTDPETVVMCARTDLGAGSRSWFYLSRDRGHEWDGPFAMPGLDQPGLSARTDVVPLAPSTALFMLTAVKRDGHEGRVICTAVDAAGGMAVRGWVGAEPAGFAIMPSSIRLAGGDVLTAVRCTDAARTRHWIDLYRSGDEGSTWRFVGTPVASTGSGGNPGALASLPDGRLVLLFGYRDRPYGLRAVVGSADGSGWSDDIVLADDAGGPDLGYPRCVVLDDGCVVICWYRTDPGHDERFIVSTRWRP